MNQYALKLQKKIRLIGGIISLIAGYDYLLDIRKIEGVFDVKQENKSPVWAISRKVHKINAKDLKDKMVLMIHPIEQKYILTRVELVEQDELVNKDETMMFSMLLPQGTFYGRISEKDLKKDDLRNIQSLSQIVGVPLLLF